MTRRLWTEADYRAYRERFPYSDEEILEALKVLEEDADAEGNAYLANRYRRWQTFDVFPPFVLRYVLPYLIKTCHVCGEKALYRRGLEGRCRTHRDVSPTWIDEYRARKEQKACAIESQQKVQDKRATFISRLRSTKPPSRGDR